MSDEAMVWTVDKYCDRIVLRRVADVLREESHPCFPRDFHKFESQDEALHFCIRRAERGVIDAKKDLDNAWKRVKRLHRKLVKAVAQ